ncbi:MAG: hypothetical protein WCO75_10220 [Planctomycetota bacterium]
MLHATTQHSGRAFRQAPARRHLARLYNASGRKDPQLIRQSPTCDQIELRLSVHALFKFRELPQYAAIGEQSASAEIPARVFIKQRALGIPEVRLMHGNQVRFDFRLARQKSLALSDQVINAKPVAHEISARCLALHHDGLWRSQCGARTFCLKDVRVCGRIGAEPPVVFGPPSGVNTEASNRAGHFMRHRSAAHGHQPG